MPVGAPAGNQNARKSRLFEQAFIRAIKQRDLDAGDGETLRKIAERMLDMALSGDVAAFRESRDTVDGKPPQSMTVGGDPENPLQIVERRVVKKDGA